MGFKAADAVKALDYDFRPFVDAHGVIPEPSTDRVERFFKDLRQMANEVRSLMGVAEKVQDGEISDQDAADVVASMDDSTIANMQEHLIDAVAGLCGGDRDDEGNWIKDGTPTREQIAELPYRVLATFNAWIGGELRPEQPKPATTVSRAGRRAG
jgi:hypothetical protein